MIKIRGTEDKSDDLKKEKTEVRQGLGCLKDYFEMNFKSPL